jgi:transglutaminase-like putative cysteine protease
MNLAGILGFRRRAPPTPAQLREQLTSTQIGWLGALLLSAQLPQAPHLPIWVAVTGVLLVVVRLVVLRHDRQRPQAPPPRIPSWTLVLFAVAAAFAVRASFGYLSGRDPSVAFLYILVAIKFLETRTTRDGALLVCLSCFLLITPFFYGQSLLAAIAVLPAVVLVGATLDTMTDTPGIGGAKAGRSAAVRRSAFMILQGVPVAILLFVLFPRLAGPLWGLPADHSAQTGLSETMEPGQISELSLSDAVAFRVDFDGPAPPPRERYWRGPVLSRFDGRTWTAGNLQYGGVPAPPISTAISYTVTLEPSNRIWLFALDLPATLPRAESDSGKGELNSAIAMLTRDQQLLARAPLTQPLRYVQQSVLGSSYPGNARFEASPNLRLPDRNPRTQQFARELRTQHPDDRQFIDAVLTWFNRENFVYTMSPPLLNEDSADEFLFDTRRGFCEHYASAFVVLLRAAGIPARVVTGYQGGAMNPRGGYMIVRQSDAHAWAEALIDGRWQRFDPTAAVAPSRIETGLGGALPEGERVPFLARLDASWLKSVRLAWDAINHDWRRNVVGFNYERQRNLWREWRLDRLAPWQIAAMGAAALFLWAGLLAAWLMFRRRRQERALVLWEDLCRRLARAGLPRHGHEGPVAFAQRAALRWPQFAIAFSAIGQSFATLRYGKTAAPRQRDALVATLQRAIEVLPSPAALRQAT